MGALVLYHFVGSSSSCSADASVIIRRLTAQLMQHVASPPALTGDPNRLVEEFPRWMEKISSKSPGGLLLVLDSIERCQVGRFSLHISLGNISKSTDPKNVFTGTFSQNPLIL
jgi:nephrocystin-3